jgi:glycosyltransferase involved in cell wall biosynthesis
MSKPEAARAPKALVVIPAYNEAASLVSVIEDLKHECPLLDFIVVNDGSSDDTARLCKEHGFPHLDLATNLGLAGAITAGMRYAYLHDYDAVVQFDSDGQHRPEYVQPLLDTLTLDHDIVCGSRNLAGSRPKSARMLGGRLIALAIRITTGVALSDPTSGLRAYGRRMIREFVSEIDITPEPDTISYLVRLGARITEIPVSMGERLAGKSYLTLSASMKYMLRMGISILLLQPFRRGSLPRDV